MLRKTLAATALTVTAALGLTACADDTSDPGPAAGSEASSQFNDADVNFAQQMIPHHQQAVEMAELAADRAANDEVRQLAEDVEAAQGPEIETMTGWLQAWEQEVPSGSMDHGDMGHGDMDGGMAGMMTEEDMSALADAKGNEFDQMWLKMMVAHHEGAIAMARTEQANGQNPDAIALAKQIAADQEAEIDQMRQLLNP